MSTSAAKISILLPCFNEAAGIPRLESVLFPALDRLGEPYEVVAVDDGSTDGTGRELGALAQKVRRLRVLTHAENRGLGAALRTGLRAARGEWIVFLDADLTFHPELIGGLLAAQRASGADCVSGSPFLDGMPGVPWSRRLPSMLLNAFYRGFLSRRLTSFTPMFRLYRAADLRSIRLASDGFEISAEILARLLRAGRTVREIPAPLTVRTAGSSKLRCWRELANHLRLIGRLLAP
ncbi:MAG: glycosyltransferase family 2 protein [Elusimicrobiota bacterium]